MWLAFPPAGLSWLAWIAPVPLIWMVLAETLPARRPYWQLYFAGFAYWLATLYFVPIPHPALWVGWLVVSAYLAIYTPMLVGISRAMVHRVRIPAVVAVPVAWTGIEWIRCHFASGMALACLSHTQYKNPLLIQAADLFGAYTLTFAISLVATGIAILTLNLGRRVLLTTGEDLLPPQTTRRSIMFAGGTAVVTLVGLSAYGYFRLNEEIQWKNESTLSVAMIQTSEDVIFAPPTEEQIFEQFEKKRELTWLAREQSADLDLIVWPEGGFDPYRDLISDLSSEGTVELASNTITQIWSGSTGFPTRFPDPVSLLTGAATLDPENDEFFNAAILISTNGQVTHRYYKNHLVMFGEYTPLASSIPFIQKISPISDWTFGTEFEIITINGVNIAPSICFETTIPHLIRRQINTLTESGTEPDVMINLTNDGWFFGTSCLDLHLACNVFRAVEMRKPHLVCANTGFSAEIDSCGRMLNVGPRRAPGILTAQIRPLIRSSLYRQWGAVIPMVFGYLSLLVGIIAFLKKRTNIRRP